jgi:hypothetical protein
VRSVRRPWSLTRALACDGKRTYVRCVGLQWTQVVPTKRWFGRDVEEEVYAVIDRREGHWHLLLTDLGCGIRGGAWLPETWHDAGDAMDAADRYVVAYVDVDVPMQEEHRARPQP